MVVMVSRSGVCNTEKAGEVIMSVKEQEGVFCMEEWGEWVTI